MSTKSAILSLFSLVAFSLAAPQTPTPTTYKVGLQVFGSNGDPSAYSDWFATINQLALRQGCGVSVATHIQFGGPVYNVDVNAVQRRAYGDVEGTIPIGNAFNVTHGLNFAGDAVGMYSILCYVVSEQEHT